MKNLLKNSAPSNLLFFDTETKPKPNPSDPSSEYHYLWFGCVAAYRLENQRITRLKTYEFTTPETLWDIIRSHLDKSRPLYAFAHNLGFDLTICNFWESVEPLGIQIDLPVIDDPPTFFCCRWNDCKFNLIDTYNYWKTSLAQIGESLGLEKLTMPTGKEMTPEWITYCHRDVEITSLAVRSLISYLQFNDLGPFAYSTPAIAMGTYKKRFMPADTITVHDNHKVLLMEREAYHGGLVHCFKIGKIPGKIYKLDVNSLYPTMMLAPQPAKYIGHWWEPTLPFVRKNLKENIGCADVEIRSKDKPYPFYDGQKLIEVVGHFRTSLCGPELTRAINSGEVVKVYHYAAYEQADLFTDYVTYFYGERQIAKQKGDKVSDSFAKIMLNSLYGKFGQRSSEWTPLTQDLLEEIYQDHRIDYPKAYQNLTGLPKFGFGSIRWRPMGLPAPVTLRRIADRLEIKRPAGEHFESCPVIAANITALARERLRELIQLAGHHNTFYCDTDSLFCNQKGYDNLRKSKEIDPSTLGKLKLEGTSDGIEVHCPKDYVFAGQSTIKGIRKNAEKLSDNTYKQTSFEGIKSILNRNGSPYVKIGWITKNLSRTYNKGIVGRDGWVDYIKLEIDSPK